MMKNDNNILSLRIKQIEFHNPPRHRNAQQEVEQSICECLNWEERLHCLESHSRGQYFSWPGHGDVTQCHAVTINNTNVTLSQMDKSCPDIARQSPFIDQSTETSWSALSPGVSGFVNAQCLFTGNDRSNAKIQNQLVPCPKSRLGMLLV